MALARSPKQIGSILKTFREAKSLTQKELADMAGVRQATVSAIETGQDGSKLSTLLEILAALDLEIIIDQRNRNPVELDDIF